MGTVADSFKNERFFSLYLQQISRKQAGNIAGVRDKKPAFKEAIFRDFKIEINPSFKIASHTEIWVARENECKMDRLRARTIDINK